MKTLLILIFFISLNSTSYCQEYFNERFGFGMEDAPDSGNNVLEIEDGYIISGGTGGFNPSNGQRFAIAKFSFDGELIFSKSWGDSLSIWYSEARGSLIKNFGNYYSLNFRERDSLREGKIVQYNSQFDTIKTITYKRSPYPYDSTYIGRDITATTDGFAIIGSLNVLQESNKLTNIPWNEKLKEDNDSFAFPTSDQYSTYQVFILSLDSLGNLKWEVTIPFDTIMNYLIDAKGNSNINSNDQVYTQGYSIIQTKDKGFAIGLRSTPTNFFNNENSNPFVIKLDSLGTIKWAINLGGEYRDNTAFVCNSWDSTIGVACRYEIDSVFWSEYISRSRVVKIDYEGNIIWDKLIGDPQLNSAPTHINPNGSHGYILSGYSGENEYPFEPIRMGFGININGTGDSLWYRKYAKLYDEISINHIFEIIRSSDDSFIGIGYCTPGGSNTGNQDAWIIKVDSLGCTDFNECWVGIYENQQVSTNEIKINIYPNPLHSTSIINIESDGYYEGTILCKVFDIYGRKFNEFQILNKKEQFILNKNASIKGIYTLRFELNGELICNKKVLIF